MRTAERWRLSALVVLACGAAPGAGWFHHAPVGHGGPRLRALSGAAAFLPTAPLSSERVHTAGGPVGIASRLEPPGKATELTSTNSAEPLSWESAVGRFGLLPGALLKLRQRDAWLGRLSSAPGMLMIRRTSKIWGFISALVFKRAISSQLPGTPEDERRLARECKEGLLELGPTFIKLGQLLSTRVDVMPPAFIEELSTLQDQCPPFPLSEVYEILDRELGPNAFAEFDPIPLAAASLGQVHLATTREGERVCVKVQRPGLEELFRVDLKNLQVLSEVAMSLDRSPDRILRDWWEIFAQNARIVYEEIDYRREAANAQQFAENFKDVPWLRVPKMHLNYSTSRVLTMEYCPGVKVSAIDKIDALGLLLIITNTNNINTTNTTTTDNTTTNKITIKDEPD
ncbi:ABC1 family-domain-containing protein [Pavlovales sp. CCMP2436]|nr:ABC1 family-domain-containing protein [Pavlovales sp. CCMP2436]